MSELVRTCGIDLASDPKNTGVCVIAWNTDRGVVALPEGRADDEMLLGYMGEAQMTAIDAPFGWPDRFVEEISGWHDAGEWTTNVESVERRRPLAYRRTDLAAHEAVNRWPLSVSTDRLGVTAMRCVALLAEWAQQVDAPVDRVYGRQRVIEAWPAGALARWSLPSKGYKGPRGRPVRSEIITKLPEVVDLDLDGTTIDRMLDSDHHLDALIMAIVAKAAIDGRTTRPSPHDEDAARCEGWLHLPLADGSSG